MKFNRRIEILEKNSLKPDLDPLLDSELTNWFKSHPDYQPGTQPENNNGVVMPKHLCHAFQHRIAYVLKQKNHSHNLCGLTKFWMDIYP
ncbi:MAG TPA: hypothetical protein VIH61_08365 [Waddliaceae bacterium]